MIELSRHIESLMLRHDCVIVPGLGGFVTQYVPSRHIAEENLFFPPYRSVGFNQQLTINDGLLVQSYMQAYDTSYPETIKLIEEAVSQLKSTIQAEGEYELHGIGRLSLGIGGNYEFTPNEAGVLSPELYGFDSFSVEKAGCLGDSREESGKDADKNGRKRKKGRKNYTFSISRELVNYSAAIAVAVVFYFLWAPTVVNNTSDNRQTAAFVYGQLFTRDNHSKEQTNKAKNLGQPQSKEKPIQPVAKVQAADDAKSDFTLVLASSVTLHNAHTYTTQLKEKGHADAEAYKKGRMVRVIYGHYATREEAHTNLKKLRKDKEFSDAWILQLK